MGLEGALDLTHQSISSSSLPFNMEPGSQKLESLTVTGINVVIGKRCIHGM